VRVFGEVVAALFGFLELTGQDRECCGVLVVLDGEAFHLPFGDAECLLGALLRGLALTGGHGVFLPWMWSSICWVRSIWTGAGGSAGVMVMRAPVDALAYSFTAVTLTTWASSR